MKREYYFAYGSNMNHAHMKKRCAKTRFLGPARLLDFRLAFLYPSTSFPGGGAADIVADKGSITWGALWQTNKEDLDNLDIFEDVALGGYRRKEVDVHFEENIIRVTTYEVCQKLTEELPPRQDYLQTMIDGAKDSLLPEEYIEKLDRF